jgi:hypothetical protein
LRAIEIIGAGPAGAAAALNVLNEGGAARVSEKSRLPRHKVCGEFLSPEIAPLLETLGVFQDFAAARPARIRRLLLRFRSREKRCRLPEAAYGLSRYRFDELLARRPLACSVDEACEPGARIVAHGRRAAAPRGRRLFGFKAHYEGPYDDAIELYFFNQCYIGINTVENGITNVCGLGPEHILRERNFDIDELAAGCEALRSRLAPLRRTMEWLMTGPLVFETHFTRNVSAYMAGDALSFVDPFTGSGILSAVLTGTLAGAAAMRNKPVEDYIRECRERLRRPFLISGIFRKAIANGWGEHLAPFVPGSWLVRMTRPLTTS